MGNNKAIKFDINNISKEQNQGKESLDKDLLRLATEKTILAMTDFRGSASEIEMHNQSITRCALGDKPSQVHVKAMIKKIIEKDYRIAQPPVSDMLVQQIYANNYGLGAIDDIFNDKSINEIWVNGYDHIWIEKEGMKTRLEDRSFQSDDDIIRVIRLLLQFDKKDITSQEPMKESRMLDGSRITVLIPPVAKRPYINIRKFEAFEVSTENLLHTDTVNQEMVDWLGKAIKGRANTLIIGETGSGKTSFLKWLVDLMNPSLRLGTIETNFELKIDEKYPERNIFSYEEHPELDIDMGDLFKTCLRSSPDIIICGEARGSEADELIRAMRRGHPGSVGTIHTNSPETSIDDLCEMIGEDGKTRDPSQLRYRVASSLDLIIQIRRFEETGQRKIIRITEVLSDPITLDYKLNDIFRFEIDPENPSAGEFIKTGDLSDEVKDKLNHYGLPYDEIKDM